MGPQIFDCLAEKRRQRFSSVGVFLAALEHPAIKSAFETLGFDARRLEKLFGLGRFNVRRVAEHTFRESGDAREPLVVRLSLHAWLASTARYSISLRRNRFFRFCKSATVMPR